MYFVGLLFAIIILAITMLLGGSPMLFINLPSVLIVVGSSIALHFATHGGKNNSAPFNFSVPDNLPEDERKSKFAAIKDFRIFLVASGWLGFLIGIVLMGANLNDLNALGPGLAAAFLTVFYGHFLSYFVYYPLQRRLELS